MKKKLFLVIIAVLAVLSGAYASDFKFVFGDLGQHAEILAGFSPSYLKAGAGYTGLSLIEGHTTEMDFLAGAGYNQRKVWQDPETGEVWQDMADDESLKAGIGPIIYDVIQTEWEFRFSQGFLDSPVANKDLLTLSAGYNGRFEASGDSFRKGSWRENGLDGKTQILPLDKYIDENYQGDVYPDLRGNRQHLGTEFYLELKLDMMDDRKMYSNGFSASFEAEWGPGVLNSALDGKADYYSLTFNAVAAYTPFSFIEDGQHWFSITLIDRANINWTDGSEVPAYIQGPVSLGRKVRGYNTWTYNTQFTAVNNFDIRFAGPSWSDIFPRVNLFLDVGYGCGDYFNSDESGSNFLASTGIQMTVSFFDFIDLGYQISYLFTGEKFTDGDANITTSFTFFLDF